VPIQTMSLELAGRMYKNAAPRLTRVWLCLKYHVFASVHIACPNQFFGGGSAMRSLRRTVLACYVLSTALYGIAQSSADLHVTAIRAGKLFEPKSGKMLANQTVLIRGEVIQAVGSNIEIPADAKIIDLSTETVLPGFIDVHTHLTFNAGSGGLQGLTISVPRQALIGAKNARITLLAGFTTVRNLGAEQFSDVALRDAINDGDVIGPRMQVSGPMLSITGGHGDNSLLPFEYHATGDGVADGPDQIRHKVRENIKYGADVIKFAASGGTMSKGDNPLLESYSPEEMQVLVTEAHRQGRKVATHAHSALSIKDAVRAGVDSVEHGIFLDDEGISLMKEHGTYLVPTSFPLFWYTDHMESMHLPKYTEDKIKMILPAAKISMAKAFKSGVKVALGTDAGVYPHGLNAGEYWSMVKLGLTPVEALQAGSINAADLMGWSDRIGAIEPGKFADIVAVNGNPLNDISILQHVSFVMKGGVVYKTGDQ
jgi:imidazolonepropionase-like amidohydrolase